MLDYLFDNFREVSEGDVEKLENVFLATFDPLKPFGTHVKTIEEAMRTAAAVGCPHTPEQIVTKAHNQIHKSGTVNLGCRHWKDKPIADRTWANFKLHFAKEVKECRKEQGDTAKEHYAANATQQAVHEARTELQALTNNMMKEFKDAMEPQQPTVEQAHSNLQTQDSIVQTLMEQNRKLMEILANKENQEPIKKR